MVRFLFLFLGMLLTRNLASQPGYLEKWASDNYAGQSLPPFRDICFWKDSIFLVCGVSENPGTDEDLFFSEIDLGKEQKISPKLYSIPKPGRQSVNAMFPHEGCWVAGASSENGKKNALLAFFSEDLTPKWDTTFHCKGGGEFFDLIVTQSGGIIAVGQFDNQAVALVKEKGAARLFQLPKEYRAVSKALVVVQPANGDILILGQDSINAKQVEMKCWHLQPHTGEFNEIFSRAGARGLAACKTYDGDLAAIGTIMPSKENNEEILFLRLTKPRLPLSEAKWKISDTLSIGFDGDLPDISDLEEGPRNSFIATGSSLEYNDWADFPQMFTMVISPDTVRAYEQIISKEKPPYTIQFWGHLKGSSSIALVRGRKNELILAGKYGGNGRVVVLQPSVISSNKPFTAKLQPEVIFHKDSSLFEVLYQQSEELSFSDLEVWLNGQKNNIELKGERIVLTSSYKLRQIPSKNAGGEYILRGKLKHLRSGDLNLLQYKEDRGRGLVKELHRQEVLKAPLVYVVSIGNNYSPDAKPLEFADDDAVDMAGFFGSEAGNSFQETVHWILDENSEITKEKVVKLLDSISVLPFNANDIFIFHISSHAIVDSTGKLLFPCYYESVSGQYIDFKSEIYDIIRKIPCKKIMFIDACQYNPSGALFEPPDDPDVFLVFSCQLGEKSVESRTWKNGAFTDELLAAMNGSAKPSEGVPFLTPEEIFRHIKEAVPEKVRLDGKKPHHPQLFGGGNILRIPFLYRPK